MEDVTIEKELPATESSITTIPDMKFAVKKTADIDGFIEQRQAFIQKVSAICVEGKDYHVIQGKKSLAKGGAEKIASIFTWAAQFQKDQDSIDMLGAMPGLVAFKAVLLNKGKFVGEGRGAAVLSKNGGDPNKTLKMAQKSAYIDAVIRASGLSDFFTQDLEDMDPSQIGQPPYSTTGTVEASEKQIGLIKQLMLSKNVDEAYLYDQGFDLVNLTGGKGGTASELIDFLMKFKSPGYGVDVLTQVTNAASLLIKDLEECDSVESYAKITNEVKIAKDNGAFSAKDWTNLTTAAKATHARLTNPKSAQQEREFAEMAAKIDF